MAPSVRRPDKFFKALRHGLKAFARVNGRSNAHDLDRADLVTTSDELTHYAAIENA